LIVEAEPLFQLEQKGGPGAGLSQHVQKVALKLGRRPKPFSLPIQLMSLISLILKSRLRFHLPADKLGRLLGREKMSLHVQIMQIEVYIM
jgi:hypothetical protein